MSGKKYLCFVPFIDIGVAQVAEIHPHGWQGLIDAELLSTMAVDGLATEGAKPSAAIVLTKFL